MIINNPLFHQLPRSLQWRVQLRIYEMPILDESTTTLPFLLVAMQQHNAIAIQQHQQRYQQLVEKYIEEGEDEVDVGTETMAKDQTPTKTILEMDPLTAMVMEQKAQETRKAELLLKYKKERARRKRGLTTEGRYIGGDESDGIDRASLVIIDKDLKRLPHPTSNNGAASGNLSPEEQTRINHLKDILYIYAQEHTAMGYRQGMHEIASYLLYALEIEQQQQPNLDNPLDGSILAICFVMLERVLDQLELAYDASGEQSLQRMSQSILSKIHQNAPLLFQMLTTSPHIPPPPIYCTRWVRLLFSREVVGFENVFGLWDVFFQFYPQIMRALEMASVARILLLQKALMNPNNNPLDLLMNVPQQQDIRILTNLLKGLMSQTDFDPPIVIPESHMTVPAFQSGGLAPVVSPLVSAHPTMTQVPPSSSSSTLSHSYSEESPPKNGMNNANNTFSFSKMKDSLGKKSESIRKKIITATNEWNRESSNGSSQFSLSTDIFTAAGDVLRQSSLRSNGNVASDTRIHSDPLRHPGSSTSSTPMPEPPSPLKHQHMRWSQGLNDRILILQNYLMSIECSSLQVNESGGERKVPSEVWEAMADLQRMQQELHNYSMYMS